MVLHVVFTNLPLLLPFCAVTSLRRLHISGVTVFDSLRNTVVPRVPENVECLALGSVGCVHCLGDLLDASPPLLARLTELRVHAERCRGGNYLNRLTALKTLKLLVAEARIHLPVLSELANLAALTLQGSGSLSVNSRLLPPNLCSLCIHGLTVSLYDAVKAVPARCRLCLKYCTIERFTLRNIARVSECPCNGVGLNNFMNVLTNE